MSHKPIVGITMGDACGIGPEVVIKCLNDREVYESCRPIVIGDTDVLKEAALMVGAGARVRPIGGPGTAAFVFGSIDVLDMNNVSPDELEPGVMSAAAGRASFEYIREAVALASAGEIDAIATAPVNKEAINRAGYHFTGHTEILAELTGCMDYGMMLVSGPFRVTHVSTHVSLRAACDVVKRDNVLRTIALSDRAMREFGVESPRIAIAGLNPHSGEGGLFGEEEIREITPAIEEAKRRGIMAFGPYPPDSIFLRASKGEFDVAVAMYHDQGHIAVKMLGLEEGVNVTIGLPIIRTSTDHGTAYDIAGKGVADYRSMKKAIQLAAELAIGRAKARTTTRTGGGPSPH
jgi:4-hydroxythreonine-4-phosphate dehydrogenase